MSGEAISDGNENSEVIWMDVQEALTRDDVPGLTKHLIQSAVSGKDGLAFNPSYTTKESLAPYSLYCL
ncbi:MAG: hypothetical protein IKM64_03400 [Clostridia bacterium]|nr:hypothetical protein [Clostridia bacterium]